MWFVLGQDDADTGLEVWAPERVQFDKIPSPKACWWGLWGQVEVIQEATLCVECGFFKGQRSKGAVALETLREWQTLQRHDIPFTPAALLLQKGDTGTFQGVRCGARAVIPAPLPPVTLYNRGARLP